MSSKCRCSQSSKSYKTCKSSKFNYQIVYYEFQKANSVISCASLFTILTSIPSFFFLGTGYHCITQAGFKLVVLLLQFLISQDNRQGPVYPDPSIGFNHNCFCIQSSQSNESRNYQQGKYRAQITPLHFQKSDFVHMYQ